MISRFKVVGQSMWPTIASGTWVTSLCIPKRLLKPGMLVVAEVEPDFFVVKRIETIINKRTLELTSDNPNTSSRFCGVPINKRQIAGMVIRVSGRNAARHIHKLDNFANTQAD